MAPELARLGTFLVRNRVGRFVQQCFTDVVYGCCCNEPIDNLHRGEILLTITNSYLLVFDHRYFNTVFIKTPIQVSSKSK